MPGKNTYDNVIREVLNSTITKRASTRPQDEYEPNDKEFVFDFLPPVDVKRPVPVYPEIKGGYPGPFLRDPGEFDPYDERYRT